MQPSRRPYSYYVTRSRKDAEFVATFLEIPGLSGLAPTVHEAIHELNQALDAWGTAVTEDEIPTALFRKPMVIIDRSFLGGEPLLPQLSEVLPEEFQSERNEANTTSSGQVNTPIKNIRFSKDNQVIQI